MMITLSLISIIISFFLACSFVLVQRHDLRYRITVMLDQNQNELKIPDNHSSTFTTANVVTSDSPGYHQVNSSFCNITSLEVYRGRSEITQISHDGFTLSSSGTIEVELPSTAHSWWEV